jgi:protein-tyrosine phosphatase
VKERGLEDQIFVESSGVNVYNEGQQADPRMVQTAAEHGIALSHSSLHLKKIDAEKFDLLIAMDNEVLGRIKQVVKGREGKAMIVLFRKYDPVTVSGNDVTDPWYGDINGFREVYTLIERTIPSIFEEIINDHLHTV